MRRLTNHIFTIITGLCAAFSVGIIVIIISAILWRGGGSVSWSFLSDQIHLAGAAGGIYYNILGSLILLATALLVSVPIATGLALVHGVYLKHERTKERLWLLLSILNGVPSILFGLFGLIVFVKLFGWGKSWLAGGILLGLMILPTVAVAFIERIKTLPRQYLEAATGLGLNDSQIVWSVVLPQCSGGLVTGSLLGLARAAGETAPIMFTATIFAGATIPNGVKENPVLSLPYHIFILAQDSLDPAAGANLWGAALVLLALVLGLSLLALPARLNIHEEASHD